MYRLNVSSSSNHSYVEFINQERRIIDFFILDKGNDKFLNFTQIVFQAQKGLNLNSIKSFDYLEGFMDVHIFSENFKNTLEEILRNEIVFYPCKILCDGEKIDFYIAKFINYLDTINREKSEYSTYSDGVEKLETPVFKSEIDFSYAVRDINEPTISLVSKKFVDLSEKHNFRIKFSRVLMS